MSKQPVIYAFIDSQNLNLGTSEDIIKNGKQIYKGWKLDFGKFRAYLKDKFKVEKAFLFIGYIETNRHLYSYLERCGYEMVYKPTVRDGSGKTKGNVDAEIVLYSAVLHYGNYDKAVFTAGDGDYLCLYEYLEQKKKLLRIVIPNTKSESSLLKKFQQYKTFIINEKEKLEEKRGKKSGRRRT